MPWKAVGKTIVKSDSGKVVGHSTSNKKAQASVRARYAATSGKESFAHKGVAMAMSGKKGR